MQIDQRAELLLYRGFGPISGIVSNGLFDETNQYPPTKARYNQALSLVLELLDTGQFTISDPYMAVAKFPDQAKMLTDYAKLACPGAHGFLRLHNYEHAKMLFSRGIVFPGAAEHQRDEIIELLKRSGYQPEDPIRDSMIKGLGRRINTPLAQTILTSDKFHQDRIWRRHLRFF